MKKILAGFMILLMGITGCKKYPDGPWLSIYTKTQRLCRTWDVAYFSIDGNDSTDYLKHQPFYGTYDFSKSQKGKQPVVNYKANNHNYYGSGTWNFNGDKSTITYTISF